MAITAARIDEAFKSFKLPLGFKFSPLGDNVAGAGLLLYQLLAVKACLGGDDHLYVLIADTLDGCLFVHVVGSSSHAD